MNSYYEKNLLTQQVTCIDDEIPFDLPQGWEWVRIYHICSMQAGKNIQASEIFSDATEKHPYRCVGGNGLRGYVSRFNTEGSHAIVGRQGALCGCLNKEDGQFYATEHAVVVDAYGEIDTDFMFYFLTALNLNQYATATAQPGLAVSKIIDVLFPLPPIQEQKRIIDRIKLVEPLVDQYEVSSNKLNSLNASINELLKKSILQEAIQGKLVPQIESEGTAAKLLEEIVVEKKRLVAEGKLKRTALSSSTIFRGDDNKYYEKIGTSTIDITEEIPFEIPQNWQWCRIKDICSMQAGKNIQASEIYDDASESHPYRCVGGNGLRGYVAKFNTEGSHAIVGRQGALCGCVNKEDGQFYATEHAVVVDTFGQIETDFMICFLYALNLNQYATATAQPGLAVSKIIEVQFPLPPIKEQHRIVSKIAELSQLLK